MTETRRIEEAMISADEGDELYGIAKSLLASGHSRDAIADAFAAVRERLTKERRWEERHEDKFIGVTDALYGWCHPSVNLCPTD